MSAINPSSATKYCEGKDVNAVSEVVKRLPKLHPTNALMVLLHNDSVRENYMRHSSPDFVGMIPS